MPPRAPVPPRRPAARGREGATRPSVADGELGARAGRRELCGLGGRDERLSAALARAAGRAAPGDPGRARSSRRRAASAAAFAARRTGLGARRTEARGARFAARPASRSGAASGRRARPPARPGGGHGSCARGRGPTPGDPAARPPAARDRRLPSAARSGGPALAGKPELGRRDAELLGQRRRPRPRRAWINSVPASASSRSQASSESGVRRAGTDSSQQRVALGERPAVGATSLGAPRPQRRDERGPGGHGVLPGGP